MFAAIAEAFFLHGILPYPNLTLPMSSEAGIRTSKLRALSSTQERKLVDYLDEQFLELTRGYKKRSVSTPY